MLSSDIFVESCSLEQVLRSHGCYLLGFCINIFFKHLSHRNYSHSDWIQFEISAYCSASRNDCPHCASENLPKAGVVGSDERSSPCVIKQIPPIQINACTSYLISIAIVWKHRWTLKKRISPKFCEVMS